MKESNSNFESLLYQNYREFIEFINDFNFSQAAAIFLIYLPNFTILTDIITKFTPQDSLWQNISLVGCS